MTTPKKSSGAPASGDTVLRFHEIVAAQDIQYDTVPTPEWGGQVRIASMNGSDRQKLVQSMRADQKAHGEEIALLRFAFRVVAASIVDEKGRHIADQEEAFEKLAEKNMAPVQRVFDACRRLSGLGQDELDSRLEDLKENPSASSLTD